MSTNADSLNGKMSILSEKTKEFIHGEKGAFQDFGKKAVADVEDLAGVALKSAKNQMGTFYASSVSLVRRNPVIAIALAVTLGFVMAKVLKTSTKIEQINEDLH